MATPISRDDRRAASCSGLRPSRLTAPKTYTTRRDITIAVLPSVPSAATVGVALGPVLKPDTVLVSESASAYKTAAKALGIVVRQIPRGTHKLGPYHIQNVNALHSRIKEGLRPFRGVATKDLPAYLAWFRFFDRTAGSAKPQQLLLDAIGVPTGSD